MAQTLTHLLTHIVFSTKHRKPYLDSELKPQLEAYLGGIVGELEGKALIINGTGDHVHMLIALPATVSVAEALRVLKTNSSRWVHEKWRSRRSFAWQAGYAAFSVSQSNVAAVSRYIANQENHHRKVSFQEELITYLKKHRIQYDERYLWE